MKKPLSRQIQAFILREKDVIKYFDQKGYSVGNVAEYCASSMIPLYIVHYFLWKNGEESARDEMVRLAEYYTVTVDV